MVAGCYGRVSIPMRHRFGTDAGQMRVNYGAAARQTDQPL